MPPSPDQQAVSNTEPSPIRNRVIGLEMVEPAQLIPHPKNWRTHPKSQQTAMQAVLKDLGTADAIIARRLEDGTYQILDGHLRTGIADENELLPALLVDLNDDEAERFLLTHDPIAELAGTSSEALEALTTEIDLGDDLKSLTQYLQKLIDKTHDKPEPPKPDTTYGTVVRHKTENDQRMLYEELKTRGYDVTVSML